MESFSSKFQHLAGQYDLATQRIIEIEIWFPLKRGPIIFMLLKFICKQIHAELNECERV
jgi:hypothetical protein